MLFLDFIYDLVGNGCQEGIYIPEMEYPLGVILVDLVGGFDLAGGKVLMGFLFLCVCCLLPVADDVHQVIVDLRLRFDLLDIGKDEIVLEIAFRGVYHQGLIFSQL